MDPSTPQNLEEEYSAAATTVKFDRPIPVLRRPIPAGPFDDPESGPYLLAFPDINSWTAAHNTCRWKTLRQCEEGARIGCAISASNKCKPEWWRSLFGWRPTDLKERERCEDREMEGCLVSAMEKCVRFAAERCEPPFMEARVSAARMEARDRKVLKLVGLASMPEGRFLRHLVGLNRMLAEREMKRTNYLGSELRQSFGVELS